MSQKPYLAKCELLVRHGQALQLMLERLNVKSDACATAQRMVQHKA